MKSFLKDIVLLPPYVKWCSQTIYQSLLGCIKIYEYTNDELWKVRATHILNILFEIQKDDGGFDIGYDFNFGLIHKKGESTSPEMLGLFALTEYGRVFGFSEKLKESCNKAVRWIESFAVFNEDGSCYIPYAPYSTSKVMVYNGTSFVCGALGHYLGVTKKNSPELLRIYIGMIKYMDSNLRYSDKYGGRYWPYYDQNRVDIAYPQKAKIDNYHQMQQVEIHAAAQIYYKDPIQQNIIHDASKYIVAVHNMLGIIPYTDNPNEFKGEIHLWGFSSVISGLIMAQKALGIDDEETKNTIKFCLDFILDKGWNGKYFYPILDRLGNSVSTRYMVRSDAWVFNSIASTLNSRVYVDAENILNILNCCFLMMESRNFSGYESHASNNRTRLTTKCINFFIR